MDRKAAETALVRIAQQTAATWRQLRGESFIGATTIETANSLYRFEDGVFSARVQKTSGAPRWESPPNMRGVELVGFLAQEGGLWSLSARWHPGALAVITTNGSAFTLTSPTVACTFARPAMGKSAGVLSFAAPSRFLARHDPPAVRRPAPPSMTRLQLVPAR